MERPRIESANMSAGAREELESLRARAAQLEAQLSSEGVPQEHAPAAAAQKAVSERWSVAAPATPVQESGTEVKLQLSPEEHDARMSEVLGVLQEKGVSAAIATVEGMNSVHLCDDFHRVLVQWVREGLPAKGASAGEYKTSLSMALFEITLPHAEKQENSSPDPARPIRDNIKLMEELYRGLLQMDARHGEYFAFEIANPAGALHTSTYIAVPESRVSLFEKQLLGLFPKARLTRARDDYNPFSQGGSVAGARASFAERGIYSLRTAESFQSDPLEVLLNAFSKLDKSTEGAAVQFVISPRDRGMLKKYKYALERIRSGIVVEHATDIVENSLIELAAGVGEIFFPDRRLEQGERTPDSDPRVKNIEQKIASPLLYADIRIVASSPAPERARAIVQEVQGAFHQYNETTGQSLKWQAIPERKLAGFAHAFSYRLLHEGDALPLSAAELAAMAHVSRSESRVAAPDIKQDKSAGAPAPLGLPQEGTLLGINRFRGAETKVYLLPEDRVRHLYLVGQTGTGKSHLLKNLVIQDIKAGAGVCFIDPHGSDVLDILSAIPPERAKDVIYFDPGYTARPMALNMLEYDESKPEQKTLVVDELFGIFKKLFGAVPESMGPAFEQYFRNAALLVMDDPASGNTLIDIGRIFSDAEFRARKLAACKNPIIKRFWEGIAQQASGEQSLENYGPYVTNKFDIFTSNEIVRPIISQQKSSFNFRDLMDNRKILLVNLAKGKIGDLNANLFGLIIVGKFLIAALSRADSFGKDLPPFYLHIDEFQNFATPSISTILSEARKYKLSLTVAHQFIAQLTDEIRDAVFGNVGSICAFRVGASDAEPLEKQFAPTFSQADLIHIDNYHAHVRLLVKGQPTLPFTIATLPFVSGSTDKVAQMQELSYLTYGRPREEVEREAMAGLLTERPDPSALSEGVL